MAMSSGYEKREFPQEPPWSQASQVSATRSLNTLYTVKWDLSIPSTRYMVQCYDMHESVPIYTNYNHRTNDSQRFIRQKKSLQINAQPSKNIFRWQLYYLTNFFGIQTIKLWIFAPKTNTTNEINKFSSINFGDFML